MLSCTRMHRKRASQIGAALFMLIASLGRLPAADSLGQALAGGRFQEALQAADSLLKSQPADPRLWTARGLALRGLGRKKESLQSFENALKIDGKFLPALKAAAELAYQERDRRAADLVNKILDLEPANGTAHAMAGVLAFEAHDCSRVLDHFAKARTEIEGNEVAVTQYGHCLLTLERNEQALEIFRQLVERQPDNANARYNLAVVAVETSRWQEAVSALGPLTSGERPNPDALNLLAGAYAGAGEIEAAVTALRRAAQVAPADERHYLDLSSLCVQHDAFALALEIVDVGLANIPGSARLYAMRGIVHAQTGEDEKAAGDFEQASRLEPDHAYGSVGLSVLLSQGSQFEEASALLRDKLRHSPNDVSLNYLLADLILRQGASSGQKEFTEAREALLRALRAKPDFARARALLGKLYLQSGDAPKAVEELQLALKSEPTNRQALNQLRVALRRLGRVEEASAVSERLRQQVEQELASDVSRHRVKLVKAPEPTRQK